MHDFNFFTYVVSLSPTNDTHELTRSLQNLYLVIYQYSANVHSEPI